MLNLANLPDKLVRKHVNELAELLSDAQKHIPNIVLPICDRMGHFTVLPHRLLRHSLDLIKFFQACLVAFVNKMHFFFIDQTLNARVCLLLLLPKIEWHAMRRANLTGFTIVGTS